jgi:hypothetical protein
MVRLFQRLRLRWSVSGGFVAGAGKTVSGVSLIDMTDLAELAAGRTVSGRIYGREVKMHNEPPVGKVKFPKGHVPQYMISRVFIPPWSLVMRGRKLLDQALPSTRKPEP